MKKIGLIFDMDGTLWDARKEVAASWSEVTSKKGYGTISIDDMNRTMGMPMTLIADTLFPSLAKEGRLALLNECTENELAYLKDHPGTLFPFEKDTLAYLAESGFPLFILSNAQNGYIEAFFEGTGLSSLFLDYICWGDNGYPKSKNIEILVRRNGLDDALYIGDTSMDEEETKKAGRRFIHAAYGFGKATSPFMSLSSFVDLKKLPLVLSKEEILS